MTLLQIDPQSVLNAASSVQPGDNSGYQFAVSILTFLLILSGIVIKTLYKENNRLQNVAVDKAESATKALVEALAEVKRHYEAFNETLKRIESKI